MMKKIPQPRSRFGRMILGICLIIGGILGFLPVLGFWMIPLGLVVLSQDFAIVRRIRRRLDVKLGRRWKKWRENRRKVHNHTRGHTRGPS